MIIDITKLLAANVFASTEQVRYYLNGVLYEVKSGKAQFVATDGHRLIVIPLEGEHGEDRRVIIPSSMIKRIKADKRTNYAEMTIEGKVIKIDYRGMTIEYAAIDGTFPDYERILPGKDDEDKGAAHIGFNPSYLGDFSKVHKILGYKKAAIKMTIYGPEERVKITTGSMDYTAVLMPVRV